MVISPISALSNTKYGTINPSQYAQAQANPQLFPLLLNRQINSLAANILFADEEKSSNIIFDNADVFSSYNTGYGASGSNSDIFSSDAIGSNSALSNMGFIQLMAKANLVGKNVEAIHPQDKVTFSGQVKSVYTENNQLYIDIDGVPVPPEYLLKVKE